MEREKGRPTGPRRYRSPAPTRSASYASVNLDGASRSLSATPTESPRSPMVSEVNAAGKSDLNRSFQAVDPRAHLKKATTMDLPPSKVLVRADAELNGIATNASVFQDYLTGLVKQRMLLEHRSRGQADLSSVKKQEEECLRDYPNNTDLHALKSAQVRKLVSELKALDTEIKEAEQQTTDIVEKMPTQIRNLLYGVLLITTKQPEKESASQADFDKLSHRLEAIEQRNTALEKEIGLLRSRDVDYASTKALQDIKSEVDSLRLRGNEYATSTSLQDVKSEVDSLRSHEYATRDLLQRVKSEVDSLRLSEKATRESLQDVKSEITGTILAKLKMLDNLDKTVQNHSQLLQARAITSKTVDEKLAHLEQTQQSDLSNRVEELEKDAKKQQVLVGNLGNRVVGQKEFNEHVKDMEKLRTLLSAPTAGLEKVKKDLKAVQEQVAADSNHPNLSIAKLGEASATKDSSLDTSIASNDDVKNLKNSLEELKIKIDTLQNQASHYNDFYKATKASEKLLGDSINTNAGVLSRLTTDQENMDRRMKEHRTYIDSIMQRHDQMKVEISKLNNLRSHYDDFYQATKAAGKKHEEFLQLQNGALARISSAQRGIDREIKEYRETMDSTIQRHDQNIIDLGRKVDNLPKSGAEQLSIHAEARIKEMEKTYSDLRNELRQSTRIANEKNREEIVRLNKSIEEHIDSKTEPVRHSIQNLTSLYNSISTQELYRPVATLATHLGPKITAMYGSVKPLSERVDKLEEANSNPRMDVENLKSRTPTRQPADYIDLEHSLRELEKSINDRFLGVVGYQNNSGAESRQQFDELQKSQNALKEEFSRILIDLGKIREELQRYHETCDLRQQELNSEEGEVKKEVKGIRESIDDTSKNVKKQSSRVDQLVQWTKDFTTTTEAIRKQLDQIEALRSTVDTLQDMINTGDIIPAAGDNSHSPNISVSTLTGQFETERPSLDAREKARLAAYMSGSGTDFILLRDLSSKMDDQRIKKGMDGYPCTVHQIWIRGLKNVPSLTTRQALVQVDEADVVQTIAFHENQPFDKAKWRGRSTTFYRATGEDIKRMLTGTPENEPNPPPPKPRPQVARSETNIVTPTTTESSSIAPTSTIARKTADTDAEVPDSDAENTITVNMSGRPRSSQVDDVLKGWGAHSGPRASPARKPFVAGTSRNSTPPMQGTPTKGTKRGVDALQRGSSLNRPTSKKGKQS